MPTANYINNRQNFEPSPATRSAWCKTRKQVSHYGSTHLPGLFGTSGYSMDLNWVILAVIIESSAVFLTIWLGYLRSSQGLIGAIFAVILFIILDYVGILLHTHQMEERSKWKNEILLTQTPQDYEKLKKKLADRTPKEDFGFLFLFLSGFLKVWAIALLNQDKLNPFVLFLFSIFYLIVIYIHSYHTGFFIAKLDFNRRLKRDFTDWSNGNGNTAQVYIHNFQTPHSLQMSVGDVKSVNFQTLTCVSFANGLYNFRLQSVGLLWDQDIATLTMGLLHAERPILAIECLQLQLTQVVSNGSTIGINS